MINLCERLRSWAQNEEMIDTSFTDHGKDCNAAVNEIEKLQRICAEAYQVVGILADDAGRFHEDAVERVLDNLSEQALIHDNVLPFPSGETVNQPPFDVNMAMNLASILRNAEGHPEHEAAYEALRDYLEGKTT